MFVLPMPTSISRTKMSAISSMSRIQNDRGTSRQMPVATTTFISEASATSRTYSTSRPRSGVVRSMIVSMPPAFASANSRIAVARVAPQSNRHG
jgi:hypothetical protein